MNIIKKYPYPNMELTLFLILILSLIRIFKYRSLSVVWMIQSDFFKYLHQ